MARTAVILLAFGGPESIDDVASFMTRLMGYQPPSHIIEGVIAKYRAIGGSSPLPNIVHSLAHDLEQRLMPTRPTPVRAAFKYTLPSIPQVIEELISLNYRRLIGISLSPHFSRITTGAYYDDLLKAALANGAEAVTANSFHANPLFLDALADKTRAALAKLETSDCNDSHLVFSAHSLPLAFVEQGDPYVEQIMETISGVMERLPGYAWTLAYQSRGARGGAWLEPDVETVLEKLAACGQRRIVLVPISFTCDHIETLYDIDIVIANKAQSLGLAFARADALNTSELFVDSLAAVVQPHLND